MNKKNNIYYLFCLRNFLFFNLIVLFATGISISLYIASENKIIALVIAFVLLAPLMVRAFYSIHNLFKYSNSELTNIEEIKLEKVYEVNQNRAVFSFTYAGKNQYTRPIFNIKNNGDFTVDKFKDKTLVAGYSKKFNEVFLFIK